MTPKVCPTISQKCGRTINPLLENTRSAWEELPGTARMQAFNSLKSRDQGQGLTSLIEQATTSTPSRLQQFSGRVGTREARMNEWMNEWMNKYDLSDAVTGTVAGALNKIKF